jgi:tetratricopeptide (TPR) repeat protein
LQDVGRHAEASETLSGVIEGTRALYGENHPAVVNVLNNLGSIQAEMGEFEKAEATHREALSVAVIAFGEGSFNVASTKSRLAVALTAQGRFEEAELLLLEAYRDIRKDFTDEHARTQATIRRLANLYERWGKEDEARRYRELLKSR